MAPDELAIGYIDPFKRLLLKIGFAHNTTVKWA